MKRIQVGFCPACGAQKCVEMKQASGETRVRVYCVCGGCEEELQTLAPGEPYGLEIIPRELYEGGQTYASRDEDDL